MAGGGHTVSPPTAAIDVAALPELVDTERMRQDEETLSAAAEEKRRNLVRHEADLQEKRRKLFNDNVAKWPSFVAELDHISQNFARQTVLTARSLLKGTKHEDTVKKAIRQLQQKAMHVTATDSALQSCEKTMGIHATVRLASIDTVPFKVALIASSVRTVADQQTKIEAAAKRLELSLKAAEKYRTRSTSRRSMRSR